MRAMNGLRSLLRENRLLKFLLLAQLLILGVLLLLCFRKPVALTITSEIYTLYGNVYMEKTSEGALVVQPPQQATDPGLIAQGSISLPSGAYDVVVHYKSVSDPENPRGNLSDSTGSIDFELPSNPLALKSSPLILDDCNQQVSGRIWLRLGAGAEDLKVNIEYQGQGALEIQRVELSECVQYRFARVLGALVLFALIDFIYLLLFGGSSFPMSSSTRYLILGVMLLGFFSSLNYMSDFLIHGHDLGFHLNRIACLAQALQDGQIPQRIQSEMLNGYGYAAPLFYGELFLLFPALLVILGLPLQTAYQYFLLAINLATAGITAWCGMKITKDWKKALVGATVYTLCSYRMISMINRGGVGEYSAMTFLPLVVYGFYRIYTAGDQERLRLRDGLPLILGLTGLIQTHTLTCETTAVFIVLLVVLYWRKTFQKNRFSLLAQSAIATLMLNLWFIVPMLQSMISMNIYVKETNAMGGIENRSAYAMQLFSFFSTSYGADEGRGTGGEMPIGLGPAMIIALVAYLFYCIKYKELPHTTSELFRSMTVCFGFSCVALILSSTAIPWGNITQINPSLGKFVEAIQFPWRFLGVAAACMMFGILLLLKCMEEQNMKQLAAILGAVMLCFAIANGAKIVADTAKSGNEINVYTMQAQDTKKMGSGAEYLLVETDDGVALWERPLLTGEGVTAQDYEREGTHSKLWCENTSQQDSYVEVPLQAYPNYVAHLEDGQETPVSLGYGNRVHIVVPAGYSGVVYLEYQPPLLWRICEAVSLVTGIALIGVVAGPRLSAKARRRQPPCPA